MSTKKSKNNELADFSVTCPYCKVCSIKLTAEEFALVLAGQQMIEVCQVCGRDVIVNV